jgi:nucleoside-diphosphate-sugar epimerase
MRIFLTGTTGFIGSHVARQLVAEGHEVHGVVLEGEQTTRIVDLLPKIKLVPLDLRNINAMRAAITSIRPDCTIHLAWYAMPGKYWTAVENLDCVTMSLELAKALAESGCRKLVAAGTCAEYDWEQGLLSEATERLKPLSLYGVAKDATRRVLESYCAQQKMGFAWARFFFLYGPAEPAERLVPSVIASLLRGQEAICSDGVQLRDFLHVADVASAVVRLTRDDAQGVVNVGSGEAVAVKDIVLRIADKLGRRDLVRLGARPGGHEVPLVVAETERLHGRLSWRPHFNLDTGLDDTIAWWRTKLEARS